VFLWEIASLPCHGYWDGSLLLCHAHGYCRSSCIQTVNPNSSTSNPLFLTFLPTPSITGINLLGEYFVTQLGEVLSGGCTALRGWPLYLVMNLNFVDNCVFHSLIYSDHDSYLPSCRRLGHCLSLSFFHFVLKIPCVYWLKHRFCHHFYHLLWHVFDSNNPALAEGITNFGTCQLWTGRCSWFIFFQETSNLTSAARFPLNFDCIIFPPLFYLILHRFLWLDGRIWTFHGVNWQISLLSRAVVPLLHVVETVASSLYTVWQYREAEYQNICHPISTDIPFLDV